MANKMADKKKNTSRSQSAALKSRPEKEQPEKTTKAMTNEAKKESRQESKSAARREVAKSSPSVFARFRRTSIGRFVFDSYYELRYKVTWPTFIEARNMTIAVILLSLAIGAILAGADYVLYHAFSWVINGHW